MMQLRKCAGKYTKVKSRLHISRHNMLVLISRLHVKIQSGHSSRFLEVFSSGLSPFITSWQCRVMFFRVSYTLNDGWLLDSSHVLLCVINLPWPWRFSLHFFFIIIAVKFYFYPLWIIWIFVDLICFFFLFFLETVCRFKNFKYS